MFNICGIGNSCIDIVANVDDAFLNDWKYPKSICSYIELEEADRLEAALPAPQYIPGGCAANTAAIVTALGGSASFIGRIADDSIGRMFKDDMIARGVHYPTPPDKASGAGSTRVFALITPDTERTFASYYGVQEELSVADLDEEAIKQSSYMYLDGYALNASAAGNAFLKAAEIARANGRGVAFSPSDLSILTKFGEAVTRIEEVSDILLCSRQEAFFMTGKDNIRDAAAQLQKRFSIGTITSGEEGVYVFDSKQVSVVAAAKPPAPVTDTNGAGDAFAGGFMYGITHGMDITKAAALGNICAAHIITHAGARPAHDYTTFLKDAAA